MTKPHCPQCFEPARRKPRTRLGKREKLVVRHIKENLNMIESTQGRMGKKVIVAQMFDYILKNIWFVRTHTTFEKVVRNKLIELNNDELWDQAGTMYQKMFNDSIPLERI
jgi:hypothetical protein